MIHITNQSYLYLSSYFLSSLLNPITVICFTSIYSSDVVSSIRCITCSLKPLYTERDQLVSFDAQSHVIIESDLNVARQRIF